MRPAAVHARANAPPRLCPTTCGTEPARQRASAASYAAATPSIAPAGDSRVVLAPVAGQVEGENGVPAPEQGFDQPELRKSASLPVACASMTVARGVAAGARWWASLTIAAVAAAPDETARAPDGLEPQAIKNRPT